MEMPRMLYLKQLLAGYNNDGKHEIATCRILSLFNNP